MHAPPPEIVSCPSASTKVESSLTLSKSPFKSSNGITSKSCLSLVSGRSSWMMYWNAEVGDYRITALNPLETLAFEFLQSLPAGLGKNFKCHWILDHNDTDIGAFPDSLLKDMEKQSHFGRLMQKMKEAEGTGPCSILPISRAQTTPSSASASDPVASASTPAASGPPVPPSGFAKARKKPPVSSSGKPLSVEGEEGAKEDPSAVLRQKKRKRKVSEASVEEAALGVDSVWEHRVNPIDRAFPADYNFRAALDTGLTNGPIREILGWCGKCLRCQGADGEGSGSYQGPSGCAYSREGLCLANIKIKSLSQELDLAEGERLSALNRMKEVEEKVKAETQEQPEPEVMDQPEPVAEEQPEVLSEQQVEEVVVGEGYRNLATFDGAEFVGAFFERFDHPVGAFPVCS
ncbi:hypothetical protein PIB30_099576 [Stylosanthes scabra]|uniref:Uncharacterized protein n=1 Tax=Stylosanthes scabra TaxID=79078 RepID=A0ABU6SXM0_9FABA|nr:hypothetical protein [Stylosanthes scabra]